MSAKAITKSRTNRTVAVLVATVVGERIARRAGVEPSTVTEALLAVSEVAMGILAVYFRQKAGEIEDRQDRVSKKPRRDD
jgi:hypothetical protein